MRHSLITRLSLVALIVALPFSSVFAASEKIGKAVGSAASIEWQTTGQYASVQLTVKGPDGRIYKSEWAAGRTPTFRVTDLYRGASEGSYIYEMRQIPRIADSVKQALAAARAQNDDAAIDAIQRANGLKETVVQGGSFGYYNGSFLPLDAQEAGLNDVKNGPISDEGTMSEANTKFGAPTVNDQVIPDDLIVQSSICAGFDCVDGESFGVDTIRMKENNTRLHFDDTSTSAGFANNDWRLTANDQPSGGANKFSIDDATNSKVPFTIEGNSPTNSIYVDSTGKIGFRNSGPGLDLHMTTSDTPAVRFEQTNAGGFTAQTWDIGANEANFFVRDLTGGSRLSFRIRPGAPTSSIDIAASGNVGIGTGSPQKKLHAVGTAVTTFPSATMGTADIFVVENNGNSNMAFVTNNAGSQSVIRFVRETATSQNGAITYTHATDAMTFTTATAERMRILSDGKIGIGVTTTTHAIEHSNGARLTTAGVWADASSRSLKQDIAELSADDAMNALEQLAPVTYAYKAEPTDRVAGFIAEDVPEIVAQPDRKSLAPMDIVAVLTKVVQEQQKTIETLNSRLEQLEKNNQ